jgi:hypothetical protein
MNTGLPPEDFAELRRLLALKRHETPPPGYFSGFSDRVIARIEREDRNRPQPWWQRWLSLAGWSPRLVGTNLALLGGLGLLGFSAWRYNAQPAGPTGVAASNRSRMIVADTELQTGGVSLPMGTARSFSAGLRYGPPASPESNSIPSGLFTPYEIAVPVGFR